MKRHLRLKSGDLSKLGTAKTPAQQIHPPPDTASLSLDHLGSSAILIVLAPAQSATKYS